ncbi:MAG TPA: hypothetical protein VGP72_16505 [Planctomycetota bacterium]|jgi:hypothetical protein
MPYTFSANGVTFQPLTSGINTAAITLNPGTYYDNTGLFGIIPIDGSPQFEDMPVVFPATGGVRTVRMGFRGRPVYATLIFVGAPGVAEASLHSVLATLKAMNRYTVTLPGGTSIPNCKLTGEGQPHWQNCNGGGFWILAVQFTQLNQP